MIVKHLPCGLFWHFDSGIERNPQFPTKDEPILLGCRVDEARHPDLRLYYRYKKESNWNTIVPFFKSDDERYFKFEILPNGKLSEIEYFFEAKSEDQIQKTKLYCFSVIKKMQVQSPTVITDNENLLRIQYNIGNQMLNILLVKTSGDLFASYLIDKMTNFVEIYGKEAIYETHIDNGLIYLINKATRKEIAQINTSFEFGVDCNGNAVWIDLNITMPGSSVYGMGEKFDTVNQQGKSVVCNVVEQYSNQRDKSYIPIPFFYTEKGSGFLQKSSMRSDFVFSRSNDETIIKINARCKKKGKIFEFTFFNGCVKDQIKKYIAATAEQTLPPKWAFGPWISSNGWNTQSEALDQIKSMNDLKIPATVMVLEAWSDEETFYIWNDAKYTPSKEGSFRYSDFTFSKEGKWPNPKEFMDTLNCNNIKLVLWQIPVVKYEKAPHGKQLDLDEEYVIENKLCIQNEDNTPYRITEMWFGNSLLPDYSNPKTLKWWFDKRRYLVEELGVAGFKTDGGEFLFDETAYLHNGDTVDVAHNLYPNMYVGAYHDFLNDSAGVGKGITFSRAGYTRAQRYPIHWAGDQISTWSELRGQLTAGLSLGLSGVPFWGFDIGGFAGDFPSTELYLRSTALAVFSPVMQFHSEPRNGQYYMTQRERFNNDRSPWNMEVANKDERILPTYRMLANLRMSLLPYIWETAKSCVKSNRPMMAHLIYDYQDDENVLQIDDEFMFGENMLVAPFINEGENSRTLYFPKGEWFNFTNGEKFEGETTKITCELDELAVFIKKGSVIPINLNSKFAMGCKQKETVVSNNVDEYEELTFLIYGDVDYSFKDEIGNSIFIKANGNSIEVDGCWVNRITIVPMCKCGEEIKFSINTKKKTDIKIFEQNVIGYFIDVKD